MKSLHPYKTIFASLGLFTSAFSMSQVVPTATENYIYVQEPTDAVTAVQTNTDAIRTIQYFDGLGRPKQTVQACAVPVINGDIIVHYDYDGFGRQDKDYLPTRALSNNGAYVSDPVSKYESYYNSPTGYNTQIYYSEKEIENSPLNRVMKQAAPGDEWKLGSGKEIKFQYEANTVQDQVYIYYVDGSGSLVRGKEIDGSGSRKTYYLNNFLYKTVTTDENGHKIEEYKNKQGQVVLKRTYVTSATTAGRGSGGNPPAALLKADTYYVYDVFGNLTYVIPPLLSALYTGTGNLPSNWGDKMNDLGYVYRYDERNRLIEKKLPGKDWEYMVYDRQDRLVATQDANLRTDGNWLFTKYDKFGRVVYTGIYNGGTDRANVQTAAYAAENNNESRETTVKFTKNTLGVYYTTTAFPSSFTELLSVNYYDSYTHVEFAKQSQDLQVPPGLRTGTTGGADDGTKGMALVSHVRITGTDQWEKTLTRYDKTSRPVLMLKTNHLGGYTETVSELNFRGQPLQTDLFHKRSQGSAETEIKTIEKFTYDTQGRLTQHTHKVGSKARELLALNTYDQLGQLMNKKVGGTNLTGGSGRLQHIDYKYNIRGWLTDINDVNTSLIADRGIPGPGQSDDMFAFHINYETLDYQDGVVFSAPASPLYNGNISQAFWRSSSDDKIRGYSYEYDQLNRLRYASYTKVSLNMSSFPGAYDEALAYDLNGNILNLIRHTGDASENQVNMDNLSYTYQNGNQNSNRLMKVTDDVSSSSTGGFSNGSSGASNDYTYDENGNMLSDLNKGITEILYNHLNLPTHIYFGDNGSIEYFYNAAGQKIKKTVHDTPNNTIKHVDYLDGFQYAGEKLQFFPTSEGYVSATQDGISIGNPDLYIFNYVYNYTDHLGNIRLSYTKDPVSNELKIMEENHYYPFGLKHSTYSTGPKQKYELVDNMENTARPTYVLKTDYQYKYNGKEFQDELGLNLYDYGARNYDAAIGRWMNIDPLAEEFYGASPYNYVGNDPIGQADMDGKDFRIDVIRDKDDNITGLKFSATVYIQGSGASKERASELNKDFDKNYGGSIKIDGIDISVDVNYVHDETKKSGDLGGDENLLTFSAEAEGSENTSRVRGNTGTIYGNGANNRTVFHESFHFMGLSDRYDDYRNCPMCHRSYKTPANPGFENDIMGNGNILSKIHYENWAKHAQFRAGARTVLGPIKGGPFNPMTNRPESYIESSGSKKIDTNSKGQLQDKKGNWYKRLDYGE